VLPSLGAAAASLWCGGANEAQSRCDPPSHDHGCQRITVTDSDAASAPRPAGGVTGTVRCRDGQCQCCSRSSAGRLRVDDSDSGSQPGSDGVQVGCSSVFECRPGPGTVTVTAAGTVLLLESVTLQSF
jgi:hypothetical protein